MIRRFLMNFFQGRNGFDNLARALWWVLLVFLLLSLIPGWFGLACDAVMLALLVYMWFRVCSRNIYKRSQENARYLELTAKWRTKLRDYKTRFSMRKEYKFFTCPTCRSVLRVPRGKGRIQITCTKCGNRFAGKS